MVTILSGVGLLLVTLAVFSLFSLKMPKGSLAMGGMADAAVATFLVEAIHKYISGDLIGIAFLREVGDISGSMGGVAAATLVPIAMGANPLFAVVAGVAVGGFGILPGFIAGYVIGFIAPIIEKKLPEGVKEQFQRIGTSVHSVEDAKEAERLGVSYMTAGHIYITDCKKGLAPRGLGFLKDVCSTVNVPVYAIGGIKFDEKQWEELKQNGASGGCIMSGMMEL